MPTALFDVLVSYAAEDRDHALWIHHRLNGASIGAYIFEMNSPGTRWVRELERHINQCQAVIVVLSADWVKSKWCKWEIEQCLHQHVTRGMLLLPVVVDEHVKLPRILRTITAVDLRPPVRDARIASVIDALKEQLSRPSAATESQMADARSPSLWSALRRAPLWLLIVSLVGTIVMAVVLGAFLALNFVRDQQRARVEAQQRRAYRTIQEAAQAVDGEVEALLAKQAVPRPTDGGRHEHRRPGTNVIIAADLYEGGRLTQRLLYLSGRLIAFDTFAYSASSAASKTRTHVNELNQNYLIDYFEPGQDTVKRVCPGGHTSDCLHYSETELSSPLPQFVTLLPLPPTPPVIVR